MQKQNRNGSPVVDVDKLLREAAEVKHADLKAALEEHAKEERAKQTKRLLAQFQAASKVRDGCVERLKRAREFEASEKTKVIAVQKALNKFSENGDFKAFTEECSKAGVYSPLCDNI